MPTFFLSAPGVIAVLGLVALVVNGAANRPPRPVSKPTGPPATAKLATQIVLSLVVVAAALYVIVFKPEAPDDHKWAYSAIACVLGFWLRTV